MLYNFQYKIYLPIFVALILLSSDIKKDTTNTQGNMEEKYGVVKFYVEEKGFGYITDHETKDDIFVYQEHLIDEIYDNDEVKYIRHNTRQGYEAREVRLRR